MVTTEGNSNLSFDSLALLLCPHVSLWKRLPRNM